ncbi:MAG: hypothetical protein RLZZ395_940, partial [Pseudomonadota bacterium]
MTTVQIPHMLASVEPSVSPSVRAWRRFRRHRLGFISLVLFCTLF